MSTVITVENIGKKYTISHQQREDHSSLRDALAKNLSSFGKKLAAPFLHRSRFPVPGSRSSASHEDFWALKDVSFEVKQGERIGIIGRNGAGKSTLLKILSRITEPTVGSIRIKGKVACLLEVGTGFHPELTGRENIYLNGAILGMGRQEIRKKFDEIVDFSEIEKFLDTPVKRYSSGMFVRLAFAVAAHLEPEILIVDEVLAVGDAQFQKKCLGKMEDVSVKEGRTVLFVSHNMGAVSQLCTQGIILCDGKLVQIGTIREAVTTYTSQYSSADSVDLSLLRHGGAQLYFRLLHLSLFDEFGRPATSFVMGKPVVVRLQIECIRDVSHVELGFKISTMMEQAIHYYVSSWEGMKLDLQQGRHTIEITIPSLLVFPGTYLVGAWASRDGEWSDDNVFPITMIEVISNDVTGYLTKNGVVNNFDKYAFSGGEVYAPSRWNHISHNLLEDQ
ncbi:MAG TPA: ABC transporter ATP-binding protein [Dongiaceae bacterium]|nr:ABC transporter ATP-binding protein [Dongiaceae bacterium]